MAELTSKFTRDDIEHLIEATGDWEATGSQEYYFMTKILDAPELPENHPAVEVWGQIREHYQQRKRLLEDRHADRQETACFLKAKLMLVRKDMQVNDVFEMAAEEVKAVKPKRKAPEKVPVEKVPVEGASAEVLAEKVPDAQQKLTWAEFFIQDLGVWEHYQKFLVEKAANG